MVRVVIAGNLLSPSTRNKEHESKAKYLTRNIKAESVEAMKNLDECLAQLAVSMMVELIQALIPEKDQIFVYQYCILVMCAN